MFLYVFRHNNNDNNKQQFIPRYTRIRLGVPSIVFEWPLGSSCIGWKFSLTYQIIAH